jgi:DMSO/TMAO reductase YedYZ molybdopterin-dependent catalytic subunit
MEHTHEKPGLITGAIIGGLLAAPLIALSYLGNFVADLPSIADDFFAWVRDLLPGDVITAGIDAMVESLMTLGVENVDTASKTIEQIFAGLMVFGVLVLFGALLFTILREQQRSGVVIAGSVAGLLLGAAMVFISESKMTITNLIDPEQYTIIDMLWIGGLFTIWGLACSFIYNDLTALPTPQEKQQSAAATGGATAQQLDRRQFIVRVGGAAATLTVIGAGLNLLANGDEETSTQVTSLSDNNNTSPVAEATPEATPNAEATAEPARATASLEPAPGTRLEITPLDEHYRIDISTRPPDISAAEWALLVNGLVTSETVMTLDNLRNDYEPVDQWITLSCISNRLGGDLISTTRWTGVPLRTLIEEWNPDPEATYMRITSADGFDEYLDISLAMEDERVMLCYAWDGQPLKAKHGFPLRVYIPERYGMKQPKWIIGIEFVSEWDEGYWVRRGWSEEAIVRTVSVVDTVAANDVFDEDGQMFVPVGGIAYASSRGISKVEVSVDDGEWVEAQLLEPLSEKAWVLWRYDWPFEAGRHEFRVRTYDGNGNMQTLDNNPVRPHGATGIHSETATV